MRFLNKHIRSSCSFCRRKNVCKSFIKLVYLIYIIVFLFFCCPVLLQAYQLNDSQRYNIIWITVDTLRADHLSCYGYSKNTSPNIDAVAKEGVIFTQAIANSCWTLPNLASMFTGQYPSSHGVCFWNSKLSEKAQTFAEILKRQGYKTAAFMGGFHGSSIFGLNQGFDLFYDKKEFAGWNDYKDKVLRWLQHNKKTPFFLFIHTYETHAPYKMPEEYITKYDKGYKGDIFPQELDYLFTDRILGDKILIGDRLKPFSMADILHIIALYDGAVSYMDDNLGDLFSEIKKYSLWNKSIIIITSTHGEALMEHEQILSRLHGRLYEEGIHIPLVIKFPYGMFAGVKVDGLVQPIDLMPSLLDFLSILSDIDNMQGKSFMPIVRGDKKKIRDYVYVELFSKRVGWVIAVRSFKWKLIDRLKYPKRIELYNIKDDPKEQRNLSLLYPDKVKQLKQKIDYWIKYINHNKYITIKENNITEQLKKRMRKAGYWWLDSEPKWREIWKKERSLRAGKRENEKR